MKIFNELSSRIDVSLNLTVATEVGQFLRRGMGSTRYAAKTLYYTSTRPRLSHPLFVWMRLLAETFS